jgi:hypothetical protein
MSMIAVNMHAGLQLRSTSLLPAVLSFAVPSVIPFHMSSAATIYVLLFSPKGTKASGNTPRKRCCHDRCCKKWPLAPVCPWQLVLDVA